MLVIAGRSFLSRFFIGSGKFASPEILAQTISASGSQLVTVAIRRADPAARVDPALAGIDQELVLVLPNTSGARDAQEALRLARLGAALTGHRWVKLEVTPDPASLLPDGVETLKATELLVAEGFTVLPYMNADPILALRLQDAGAATVMPLAAPIGTNKGLRTADLIAIIIENARVPVIVDAGIGLPSHAAEAMEMGADAVLVNTALATSRDPGLMASAFRHAVIAGREAFLAGPGGVYDRANASSPLTGFLR
ncbi:thiazole synthase [Myxococcota bacterium]|nr:thiazole synthase [Myxococcota bacterium]MBU1535263.1 thiazole synthase [Myxococcota bacterium]